jgi:hypothetical protein
MHDRAYEDKMYNHWLRLDRSTFRQVYDLIKHDPKMVRQDTRCRKCVPAEKRLVMTLVWLAHGLHFKVLGQTFGVGTSTACNIVHDTIDAMARILPSKFIKFPRGAALQSVMADFAELGVPLPGCARVCQGVPGCARVPVPGCAGAIDGCFIPIIKPPGPWGYKYWCYKHFHSIILMAVVDAKYRFSYVSVGEPGCVGDSATFLRSSLATALYSGRVLPQGAGFPQSRPVDHRFRPYLLGDAAFRAESFLVKDFPGHPRGADPRRLFNVYHCRMRRCVENAFGHLKGAFRVLCKPCTQDPVFLTKVVRVCCAVHNIRKLDDDPSLSTFTEDERRAQIPEADENPSPVHRAPASNATRHFLLDILLREEGV